MKRIYTIAIAAACVTAFNVDATLNQYGFSTILPSNQFSQDAQKTASNQRIAEEIGTVTTESCLKFLEKIYNYTNILTKSASTDQLAVLIRAIVDAARASRSLAGNIYDKQFSQQITTLMTKAGSYSNFSTNMQKLLNNMTTTTYNQ